MRFQRPRELARPRRLDEAGDAYRHRRLSASSSRANRALMTSLRAQVAAQNDGGLNADSQLTALRNARELRRLSASVQNGQLVSLLSLPAATAQTRPSLQGCNATASNPAVAARQLSTAGLMDIDESSPSRASDEYDEYAGDGDEADDGDEQQLEDERQGADSREEERTTGTAATGSRLVDTQTAIAELAEAQQVQCARIFATCSMMFQHLVCTRAFETRGIFFLFSSPFVPAQINSHRPRPLRRHWHSSPSSEGCAHARRRVAGHAERVRVRRGVGRQRAGCGRSVCAAARCAQLSITPSIRLESPFWLDRVSTIL
jgi:hypothetical protein